MDAGGSDGRLLLPCLGGLGARPLNYAAALCSGGLRAALPAAVTRRPADRRDIDMVA